MICNADIHQKPCWQRPPVGFFTMLLPCLSPVSCTAPGDPGLVVVAHDQAAVAPSLPRSRKHQIADCDHVVPAAEVLAAFRRCLPAYEQHVTRSAVADPPEKLQTEVAKGESLLCLYEQPCGCQLVRHTRGAGVRLYAQKQGAYAYLMETSQRRFLPGQPEKRAVRVLSFSLGEKMRWVGPNPETPWQGMVRALHEEADILPSDVVFYDRNGNPVSDAHDLDPLAFYEAEAESNFPSIPTFTRIGLYLAHVKAPSWQGYVETQSNAQGQPVKISQVDWYLVPTNMDPFTIETPAISWGVSDTEHLFSITSRSKDANNDLKSTTLEV